MEQLWARAAISSTVLVVASFVILFRPADRKARDWAFTAVGLLLGYWLR